MVSETEQNIKYPCMITPHCRFKDGSGVLLCKNLHLFCSFCLFRKWEKNNKIQLSTRTERKNRKKGDTTITVAASAGWIRDVDRELAAKFQEETGIEVDIQANSDDQYEKVLMTRLASGEGPDIYMGELGIGLERYQPDSYALDLSDEAWVEKYPDWMIDQASYDGKIVGFTTWGRDFRAMLYNKEIFEGRNIEVKRNLRRTCPPFFTIIKIRD